MSKSIIIKGTYWFTAIPLDMDLVDHGCVSGGGVRVEVKRG